MKKLLVLFGSVLVAGCFICHKPAAQQEIVEQVTAPQEAEIITRYTIVEAANFEFDSSEVKAGMNTLGEVEEDIAANPHAIILVEGHTDNIGTEEYNKKLSVARAKSVAQVLAERGYPNQIRVYGAGSSSPIASNDTEEGRAENRRVDVILIDPSAL